ncbi:hypothetical protein RJT34_20028 [Clitoria ternatea]|uniref:Uncharacterized protein n=1 Tax=Clitoria ternatea TaxID=43366 RepID=A0AAN9IS34_CLITE
MKSKRERKKLFDRFRYLGVNTVAGKRVAPIGVEAKEMLLFANFKSKTPNQATQWGNWVWLCGSREPRR